MAERAIGADPGNAARDHPCQANRHIAAVATVEAKRRIAARSGEVLGEHARQHEPDQIWNAVPLVADRAVEKVFLSGREMRRRLLARQPPGRIDQDDDDQQGQQRQGD